MPRSRHFKPPQPVGEPFRGDPKDPLPFVTEGSPDVPAAGVPDAMSPWMTDEAFPSHSHGPPPQGPPSLNSPPQGQPQTRPQFRPQPKPPLDPAIAQRRRVAKIGLGAGIASIVLSPLLGPIGIALGVMAIRRGERRLGLWAVATGAAGILIGIIVVILVSQGVIDPEQMLRDLKKQQ